MEPPTIVSEQPDPILARLERRLFPQGLTSEEKIRRAVRAAKLEIVPAYVEILKKLPPEVKLANAYSLFTMARDALCQQEIRRGLSPEEAKRVAAQRMLKSNAW
jgi:hypothetical protein